MRFTALGLLAVACLTTPASATVYVPGDPQFTVLPEPGKTIYNSPVINGILGVIPNSAGTFTDDFEFTIPQQGFGSGSIITTADLTTSSNYIQFLSVIFDGNVIPIVVSSPGSGGIEQTAGLTNIPIVENVLNTLQVTYKTQGAGSYGGQLTFDRAAVPEPTTWASFLLGFGILGFVLRSKGRKPAMTAWSGTQG